MEFDGVEKTFSQMNFYLKSPDRNVREKAWLTKYKTLAGIADQLDSLFDELMDIRNMEATNANLKIIEITNTKKRKVFLFSRRHTEIS